jgi:hypothetical protein
LGHSSARAASSSSSASTVNVWSATSTVIRGLALRLWYQAGWAGDPPLEATIAKRPSPPGEAARRQDAFDPGLGADVVDEDQRGARPWPADASLVRPEHLNDLGVIVVGPACSRVRHDLLQHLAAAQPLGCSALGLPEYPLIQTSQIGGNRHWLACDFQSCPVGMSWVPAQAAIGPGRSRKAQSTAAEGGGRRL